MTSEKYFMCMFCAEFMAKALRFPPNQCARPTKNRTYELCRKTDLEVLSPTFLDARTNEQRNNVLGRSEGNF